MFIPTWIISAYLLAIGILFSYALLIGRASSINNAPLFVISLLPSVLLSGIGWLAKRATLSDNKKKDKSTQTKSESIQTKSEPIQTKSESTMTRSEI